MSNTGKLARLRTTDFRSLQTRWTATVIAVGIACAAGWVAFADHASEGKHGAGELARVEAIALSAAVALDGDVLENPEGGTEGLHDVMRDLATAHGYERSLCVLAIDENLRDTANSGQRVHLQGVLPALSCSTPTTAAAYDLTPELAEIVAGERSKSTELGEHAFATYVALPDSFGKVVGLVRAEGSLTSSLLDRSLNIAGHSLLALLVVALLAKGTSIAMGRHCAALMDLAHRPADLTLGRFASTEVRALAETLEHAPMPEPQSEPTAPTASAARPTASASVPMPEEEEQTGSGSRAQPISPAGLTRSIVAPYTDLALERGVFVRLIIGERVPESILAAPGPITEVLDELLKNALARTSEGSVRVRVSRVVESHHLQFEVTDSGGGIPLAEQGSLRQAIQAARMPGDEESHHGLERASALTAGLGGELAFESQPGSGSRFWFTVRLTERPEPALV